MSGCKRSIWKILSAGAALFLVLPRLALGEYGVCPPYSKTFGPDDPPEEVEAFIAEINLRPGGGTLVLEPEEYENEYEPLLITGVVCIRSSEGDSPAQFGWPIRVASGAIFTSRAVDFPGMSYYDAPASAEVEAGATFFAEGSSFGSFVNHGAAYLEDCSFGYSSSVTNFGRLVLRGGGISGETGKSDENHALHNYGWALLEKVRVDHDPYLHRYDCWGGSAIANAEGGSLTLAQSIVSPSCGHSGIGDYCCASGLVNQAGSTIYVMGSTIEGGIANDGGTVEIRRSISDGCATLDAGYNVFSPDAGCHATDPTSIEADPLLDESFELGAGSPAIDLIPLELCPPTDMLGRARTDGNGDGTVACDSGALEYGYASVEVVVRSVPYWRSVGKVDLSRDTALFIAVMSGGPVDPTSIVFDSIMVGDFPRSAMRGVSYHDKNWDGVPDYNFWYRLDRDLVLECRYYDEPFTAMTDDGLSLAGRLQFEVVGCTP